MAHFEAAAARAEAAPGAVELPQDPGDRGAFVTESVIQGKLLLRAYRPQEALTLTTLAPARVSASPVDRPVAQPIASS
jgi:hypothetical protein